MKPILPLVLFLTLSFTTYAQSRSIEIYCKVYDRFIFYNQNFSVPDSLEQHYVKLENKHIRSDLDIVSLLGLKGWQLVSTTTSDLPRFQNDEFNWNRPPSTVYVMKKTVTLSEEQYQRILQSVTHPPTEQFEYYPGELEHLKKEKKRSN